MSRNIISDENLQDILSSILKNQESTLKLLKIELSKLNIYKSDNSFTNLDIESNLKILKNLDRLIESLIVYEWVNNKKLESIMDLVEGCNFERNREY